MKVLARYLGRSILGTTLLTLLVLISLSGMIRFIEQLRKAGEGCYDLWKIGCFTLLKIPGDLRIFFPMAVLPGVLLGLGALATRSELVAMEALGCSRLRIATAVIKSVIPLILLSLVLGEWVAPRSDEWAVRLRTQALHGHSQLSMQGGMWVKDDQDFIHIEHLHAQHELQGVHIYHFDAYRLTAVTHAKRATFGEGRWQLHQVDKIMLREGELLKLEQRVTCDWPLLLTPEQVGLKSMDPDSLSMTELQRYIAYLQQTGQESGRYQLAFWRNLLSPFSTIAMVLLAFSGIFGPLRHVTVGIRVVAGVSFGFIFHVVGEVFGQLGVVFQLPVAVAAFLPILLCVSLAVYLLTKRQ